MTEEKKQEKEKKADAVTEIVEGEKQPETKIDEPMKEEVSIDSLSKKLETLEAKKLGQKLKVLEFLEERIDKKLEDFKKFVEDQEVQGRSLAAPAEKTEEEKQKEEIKKMLDGTGLSID